MVILDKIKIELQRILGAFIFYTTIPFSSELSKIEDTHSSRYFSFVGVFVGIASATVYLISQLIFSLNTSPNSLGSSPISILLGMAIAVLITGALHEDGFADTFDGIFGGWSIKERLDIMKDSSIGTYGSLGLVFIIMLKFFALLQIEAEILPYVWIAGHALSRFVSISQICFVDYVQNTSKSKSKSMVNLSKYDLIVNAIFGFLPLLFISEIFFTGLVVCLVGGLVLSFYYKKKIGGVTGDNLGATQQISEVIFYLCI